MLRSHGKRAGAAGLIAAAALLLAGPAPAQVYDFDNVVLLANRDLFSGYNDVWGFVGNDGREYIIQGLHTGTAWWDVQDPQNPVMVAMIPAPTSSWRDMFVIGDHVYIGCENSGCGIQIVDISDPTSPVLVTTYTATVGNSHNVYGDPSRNLVFTVGGFKNTQNGGIQIFDVTNPVAPVEIGQWDSRYVHDMSVEGNNLYACLISNSRLRIIDASDSTAPVNLGNAWVDPSGSVHSCWPFGDGQYLAIAEETTGGHVKLLDISDPNNIINTAIHNPAPAASAHNVHVQGTMGFVSWYARGTRILDFSDPFSITEIGYWDTYPDSDAGGVGPGQWGVYPHLPSGLIAANDRTYGLFLMQYDPTAGTIDGTVSSSVDGLLAGATAEFVDLDLQQETDSTGVYKFSSFPGSGRLVRFSAYGHQPDSVVVTVPSDGAVTNHVVLTKFPSGGISGTVTDAVSGLPLAAADVVLVGTPFSAVTDSTGAYSFPDVPAASYTIDVLRYGYIPVSGLPVTIVANQVASQNLPLQAGGFFTDFSDPTGWTVSSVSTAGDPANDYGDWEFGEPFGTFTGGIEVQPNLDHTLDPEDQAAVTGNLVTGQPDLGDVDSLTTRLVSPVYDLSAMAQPHLFYYRWYSVNVEAEPFEVEATTNGGSSWLMLESTTANEAFWKGVDIDLTGLLGAASAVQFRFTAQDPANAYRVEAALDDVTIYDAGASAVDAPVLPPSRVRLELAQNAPNPFRGGTEIRFSVPNREHVLLSIYDVRGARVATVFDEVAEAGRHTVAWDGRTFSGRTAASGLYFYKLQTQSEIRSRKMVRLD